MARITKETLYLRYEFSQTERLEMGSNLGQSHNRMADIDAEEAVVKSQFKERRASIEQTIGTLSRNLTNGFEMRNIECRIEYDTPNVGELTYRRVDSGEVAKTRPMSESERQQEIEFDKPIAVNPEEAEAAAEESAENISEFFGSQDATAPDQPMPIEEPEPESISDDDLPDFGEPQMEAVPGGEVEVAPVVAARKPRGRRPQGFDGPTNKSAAEW